MKGRMRPYLPELTIRDYNLYLRYLRGVRRQLYEAYGLYSCHLLRSNGVLFAILSDSLAGRQATCQRKSMRYVGSCIGRIFYLLDKAERFETDKRSGRYNVFVVNDLRGQAAAVENARRQALAAANDLIRVYSMLDIKLNRGLLDNIMLLGLHHAVDPLEAGAEREKWEIP